MVLTNDILKNWNTVYPDITIMVDWALKINYLSTQKKVQVVLHCLGL